MASKKLSYDQIAEKGLLDPLINDIERLNGLLKATETELKKVVKQTAEMGKNNPLESYSDLKQAEEAINKQKKAVEGLSAVEKHRS